VTGINNLYQTKALQVHPDIFIAFPIAGLSDRHSLPQKSSHHTEVVEIVQVGFRDSRCLCRHPSISITITSTFQADSPRRSALISPAQCFREPFEICCPYACHAATRPLVLLISF
jgi:hypothetical protein